MYQNGVKIMDQAENPPVETLSTRKRASRSSAIGMMMLDKLLEVVGDMRMMLHWTMDGLGPMPAGLVLALAEQVEVTDMEVEVLIGMTVVEEDEVMGTLNLRPLRRRRAPMVIPTGSTSSSLSVLADQSQATSRRYDGVCLGKGRRGVHRYRSRRA